MLKLHFRGNSVVLWTPTSRQLMIGQGKMASSCTKGSSGCISGKISTLKGWLRIEHVPQASGAIAIHGKCSKQTGVALCSMV